VEVKEPDSTINLSRISTGRWYRTRRRLYLTMDSRSMGEYWSCAPFMIRLNILRRSDTCGGSKHMLFNRIVLPKHVLKKKNKEERER
jgi:hypothetical protein